MHIALDARERVGVPHDTAEHMERISVPGMVDVVIQMGKRNEELTELCEVPFIKQRMGKVEAQRVARELMERGIPYQWKPRSALMTQGMQGLYVEPGSTHCIADALAEF